MKLLVQLQKRIDDARAELARLEAAAAVIAELNGGGKARTLDRAALTLADGSEPQAVNIALAQAGRNGQDDDGTLLTIPPALAPWARGGKQLTHDQRRTAALAVVDALLQAHGKAPTRADVCAVLRALGLKAHAQVVARFVVVKLLSTDRAGRLHLTQKGHARVAPYLTRAQA